ncbi:MAG: hypothetical protein FD123_2221 [Bacteroidetes bacterium]|nr:MAG: hypothetical protein FD123_2221 [Bacteroidota bacterium]
MKKTLITALAGLALTSGFAQTATNFTANDCNIVSHDLFTELDAGKVVVITWVMPCAGCISAASTASNTVAGYANPNVVFYLCDDYANSSCNTINSWAATNSITATATFTDASISMADYGTAGMPKTVVLGGTSHTVFLNTNGTVTSGALTTAIDNALVASGIVENNNTNLGLSIFPNPAVTSVKINYTLPASTDVTIEITDILGKKVSAASPGKQTAGKQEYEISIQSLAAGVYYIKLLAGSASETVKLTVTR